MAVGWGCTHVSPPWSHGPHQTTAVAGGVGWRVGSGVGVAVGTSVGMVRLASRWNVIVAGAIVGTMSCTAEGDGGGEKVSAESKPSAIPNVDASITTVDGCGVVGAIRLLCHIAAPY